MGAKYQDLSGKVFSKLTVLERSGTDKNNKPLFKCKCECGNIAFINSYCLKSKNVTSCGCLKKHRTYPGQTGQKILINRYKRRCNRSTKTIEFLLSNEEFIKLTQQNCYYCNKIPSQISQATNSKYIETNEHTTFKYNGIDRLDSNKNYEVSNCVSCCKTCNIAKAQMTIQEFKEWINRVKHVFIDNNK